MNSVVISIRVSKTILSDVKSVTVTTSVGDLRFVPTSPNASGSFCTAYSNPAPGKFAILTEVPSDGIESSPGPVDDPGHPTH